MRCSRCQTEKSNDLFPWAKKSKNKRHKVCRVCYNKKAVEWRNNHIEQYREYDRLRHLDRAASIAEFVWNYKLEHPCECGETDPVVLDFDHITGKKKFGISEARHSNRSFKQLKAEIAKCIVRCANCHRRKTAKDQKWWTPNAQSSN